MNFKVIRCQGQGHGLVKVAKMADFEVYISSAICWVILNIIDDYDNMGPLSKFCLVEFVTFVFVFVLWDFGFGPECIFSLSSDGFKSVMESRERD